MQPCSYSEHLTLQSLLQQTAGTLTALDTASAEGGCAIGVSSWRHKTHLLEDILYAFQSSHAAIKCVIS